MKHALGKKVTCVMLVGLLSVVAVEPIGLSNTKSHTVHAASSLKYGKVLSYGHRGNAVKMLQKDLNKHGYQLDVDGIFGPKVRSAVRQFQQNQKLVVDGYVGKATQAKLAAKPTTTTTPKPTTKPKALPYGKVLSYGHRGTAVKTLQKDLNKHGFQLKVDGIFGPNVRTSVRQFQQNQKLVVDGYVGKDTQAKLIQSKGNVVASKPTVKPTYIQSVLVVNKKHPLPTTFAPGESKEARAAFHKMAQAIKREKGKNIIAFSGYRTYQYQKQLFDNYALKHGVAEANRWSAKPGYSEHQTGLVFDVGEVGKESIWTSEKMSTTVVGKWIATESHKYGFIVRYPKGKEKITGYIYEPWHLRYVGVDLATKVHKSGLTLEEYLGFPG